ncbi:DNA repair protein rad13 [Fulvia fulva]|uniref:DNA repair protein rad13 n=1 Tax=Passalora fulva TaxID=5499 RepID=A0A9Q8P3A2_PASFU|nr:DNA repair protein rad13 [Fulvia fulva]KAK4634493.1 DNA repair protein rad13 [Fulvia fulva]KAK4638327.1 DNA repair protein rad13 [Fulvia fulva]UJO11805.1 DNA repair protein rad13 [Fulvia fulva]WPV09371.1 DNA repair protein rad13 [Fulvia fulva]WPV24876.1 DNA repair protein rad13 [Fulvia fulva]
MGVTGLWQILQPCARPIKIETLNRKRLAVDASIWIYQFLKAVRDKEGNALRNSHIVGFFRRICKLLFFGIKPVFVFDGGAPALKRQTIRARKARREGRREDAARTAGKLLAVQMQRRAEEEEAQRKAEPQRYRAPEQEEAVPDDGLVYVDELQMTQQERQQNRKFRKKDQYHLPEMDMSMSEMGGPNDPRVMSLEELQAHARSFDTGEDINVYDFSKIDYDSPFFMSLPASDRYNILNAARLRSRLRMGHSKEQLDVMFPDRMAFSKFQIERVQERNELTQRLMRLNGSEDTTFGLGRIAGEKGREYVLVKNDGVKGGWALGVISEEGKEEKPIDIDKPAPLVKTDPDGESEDEFEDIPIEGLNRLPKRKGGNEEASDQLLRQRRALYSSRRTTTRRRPRPKRQTEPDPNSLFVQDSSGEEDEWGEVQVDDDLFGEGEAESSEDEDLRKAIAMSMEGTGAEGRNQTDADGNASDLEQENLPEAFKQSAAKEQRPIPRGNARAIANILNKRAHDTAPESREITSFGVPTSKPEDSDDNDDSMDLQAALAESRRSKRRSSPPQRRQDATRRAEQSATDIAKQAGFKGPLPFEKLDLGSSLLGKKKMQERTEEAQGGFENPALATKEKKKAEPLPPWFSGDIEQDLEAQRRREREARKKDREFGQQFQFQKQGEGMLQRADTGDVIELDGDDDDDEGLKDEAVIDLEHDETTTTALNTEPDEPESLVLEEKGMPERPLVGENLTMGDMADEIRAQPNIAKHLEAADKVDAPPVKRVSPTSGAGVAQVPTVGRTPGTAKAPFMEDSEEEGIPSHSPSHEAKPSSKVKAPLVEEDDGDILEWSESDREDDRREGPNERTSRSASATISAKGQSVPISDTTSASRAGAADLAQAPTDEQIAHPEPPRDAEDDEDLNFEDVELPEHPFSVVTRDESPVLEDQFEDVRTEPHSGLALQESVPEGDEYDDFSDPEDAEILRALTLEAEEHARFASSLNNKSQAQNIQEYEKELKQLRNQQKKDRRDADEVTQIMIQECQALLRLFGLPYITAPMEAEAQCAELVHLGLVDGIVTDDSDCFLFGGTRIYKNMFNQAKFVECYLTSDLEKEFDLTRNKLIAVAHLLGSDYTDGIPGIGPVTALEIISEFGSLEKFKEWWTAVQMNQIPKEEDAKNAFRKKFRKNATKLFLPPAFPDARVELAYQQPDVDATQEAFQWGVPDLAALRSFLMATIGWSEERTDEVLVPVIKDMNRRVDEGTQANITAFFDGGVGVGAAGARDSGRGEGFAPRKRAEGSKRMGSALSKMAQKAKRNRNGISEDFSEEVEEPSKDGDGVNADPPSVDPPAARQQQRKRKSAKAATQPEASAASGEDESEFEGPRKKKAKRKTGLAKSGRRKRVLEDE